MAQYSRSTSSKNIKCDIIGEKVISICHIEKTDFSQVKSSQDYFYDIGCEDVTSTISFVT